MEPIVIALWMTLAGGFGAVIRFFIAQWQGKLPWGILAANMLGSFILGAYYINDAPEVWLIVAALTGGISTFSSVAANTWQFVTLKLRLRAFLNLLLNFALPYTAAFAGLAADLLIR